MPHFFFHLRTTDGIEKDMEGITFPSLGDARDDATSSLREMVSDAIAGGHTPILQGIDITDGLGTVYAKIDFADVLD